MAKNIQALAKKLGATVVRSVPDYSAGVVGIAELANALRECLGRASASDTAEAVMHRVGLRAMRSGTRVAEARS